MTACYEQLEHTADLALRIRGRNLQELFANAAYAMFSQLADVDHIVPTVQHLVRIEGTDREALLVNWLNELLYLHETQGQVYSAFDIHELSPHSLRATVRGDQSEDIHTIIKAATHHDLAINETPEGYVATVVFDV
jgi:SHS2 domain-containing protein